MLSNPRRTLVVPTGHLADFNTILRYPAEKASWIWHPDKAAKEAAVLRFRLKFNLKEKASPLIHVTGDQRFQLRCDGQDVTFGPDRCDLVHWTFQSVKLDLAPGDHELEAIVWYISEVDGTVEAFDGKAGLLSDLARAPQAQISWRGGFLLYGEGVESSLLTTGEAPWQVEDVTDAVKMVRPSIPHYLDIGPIFTFDLAKWSVRNAKPAAVIVPGLVPNPHGVRRPGWALFPAELPEQERKPWSGGHIRAFKASADFDAWTEAQTKAPEIAAWQKLVGEGKSLVVPANSKATILWDLDVYRCGYPVISAEGGKGALVQLNWAEALYELPNAGEMKHASTKGHRGEIVGKSFVGLEDGWIIGAEKTADTPALWWRCGRYVQIRVTTGSVPLTLTGLSLVTTGYPLDWKMEWKSSDKEWDSLMPLFENAFKIAAHETWTDTPYYEQMCYVGDNLLNAVANYACFGDARISRRSVELYEWSRRASGLVAERYPSSWRQECFTFALYWPVMVRDYAWWRDDVAFTKSMLPGLRSVIAEFDGLVEEDGLLHKVPGWPFIDWINGWHEGVGPGAREGDSSTMNLIWVMALNAAAQVEEAYGDPLYAQRHRVVAKKAMDAIVARYWDEKQGAFRDTPGLADLSEHSQMYALLTGLLDEKRTKGCLDILKNGKGLKLATIYSAYYTLEVAYKYGDESEFFRRLEYWRTLPKLGFTSTPEAPEPTRSDSHPWGAHPAYHTLASIAGVRPDAPGFAKVKIAPMPGKLEHFEAKVVHPKGFVQVAFKRAGGKFNATVNLPQGITGSFVFGGKTIELKSGKNEIAG